jgi:hypothetical protein
MTGKKRWEPLIIWDDPAGREQIERIGEGYRLRLGLEEQAQSYQKRKDRLRAIQTAAQDLMQALANAGTECTEELRIVGQRLLPPDEWPGDEPNIWRISQVAHRPTTWEPILDWDKNGLGWTRDPAGTYQLADSVPMLSLRLRALEIMTKTALADPTKQSKGGSGVKPFNNGEASPNIWLVNECWSLLVRQGVTPATSDNGPFARFLVFVVQQVIGGDAWLTTRLKNEISKIVNLRNRLDPLLAQFESLYDSEGSPLLRERREVDSELEDLTFKISNIYKKSRGLIESLRVGKLSLDRVQAFLSHNRNR